MIVKVSKKLLASLLAKAMVVERARHSLEHIYSDPVDVDLRHLTPEGVALVQEQGDTTASKRVASYLRLLNDPANAKVGKLENIPTLVKGLMAKAERKWLFRGGSGQFLAWFITDVKYNRAERDNPASVRLALAARVHGKLVEAGVTWHHEDIQQLKGGTIADLLQQSNYTPESPDMLATYDAEVARYVALKPLVGVQMLANGQAVVESGRWETRVLSMDVDGQATKVVLDDGSPECNDKGRSGKANVSQAFWAELGGEDAEEKLYPVPVHPMLYCFSLRHHLWVDLHVNALADYQWQDTILDKLVLPADNKRLVKLLVQSTGANMDDIVAGKSAGVIVLASGPPGVGKTLTAEATSEQLHKPLYSVQCSQLGTKVEGIEEKLGTVLNRATRWGAVMLIDEADVYVRARGSDIHQNAIVGVFLRTLEYYNGFLFMTTNRATITDDAILSRLTAHVRYELPTQAARRAIVGIQAQALGVELDSAATDYLAGGNLSGRDVRSMLKLAKFVAVSESRPVDADLLRFCATYQDFSEPEA